MVNEPDILRQSKLRYSKSRSATTYPKRGDGILELAVGRAMVWPRCGVHFLGFSVSIFNPSSIFFLWEFVEVEFLLLTMPATVKNLNDRHRKATAHAEKTLSNISWRDFECLFDACRATKLGRKEKLFVLRARQGCV